MHGKRAAAEKMSALRPTRLSSAGQLRVRIAPNGEGNQGLICLRQRKGTPGQEETYHILVDSDPKLVKKGRVLAKCPLFVDIVKQLGTRGPISTDLGGTPAAVPAVAGAQGQGPALGHPKTSSKA